MTYESLQRTITAKRILIKIMIVLLSTALVTTGVLVYTTLKAKADGAFVATVTQTDPLTYNGAEQTVTPNVEFTYDGAAVDGSNITMTYSLTGAEDSYGSADTVLKFTTAGDRTVYYKATGTINVTQMVANPEHETNPEAPEQIEQEVPQSVNYSGEFTVSIAKPTLTLTWDATTSFPYDGSEHKPGATVSGVVGQDNITVEVTGGESEIGNSHTATAVISSTPAEVLSNYNLPTNTTQAFSITTVPLTLTWTNTSFAYDGTAHKPTATLSGILSGDAISVNVSGEQINIGSYNARAAITGSSEVLERYTMPSNLTQSFTIRAANIGTFYPSAKSVSVDYNGQEQTVDLGMQESSLTKTVEGVVYTLSGLTASATGKDAGNHEGTITGTAVIRDASGNDCTDQFTVSIPTNSGNLTIRPKSIANATIKLENDGKLYYKKGTSQTPKVVSVTVDGMTVPSDAYTVNCTPQTDVNYGYTLSVSANSGGNFSGTATTSWEIKENSKDVTNPTVVTSGGKKSGSSYSSGSRSGSSYSSSSSSSGSGSRGSYGSTSSSGGGYYDADGNWVEDESVEGDGGIILTAEEVLRYVEISFDKENGQTSDGTAINAPTIKVASIKQAAQAILSEEAKQAIREDKHVSIKITTKAIEAEPTEDEKAAMESGIRNYSNRLPGLTKGMYMDIAIETSIDGGPWQQTTVTTEPVQFIIDVPSDLQKLADTFYVMRIHDGECTLLYDRDKDPATVTIETQLFSTYVMMYQDEEAAMAEGAGTLSATENRTAVSGAGTEKKYWVILYIYLTAILGVGIAILVLQVREMSWKDSLYAQRRPERAMAQPQQQPRNKEKLAGVQA